MRASHGPLLALAALASLAALLLHAPPAHGAWVRPVRGPVVGRFDYTAAAPFRAGARRGVDLRAAPLSAVRAACSGVVRFAGPAPLRGLGVTLRCGRFLATELGLSSVVVRRGAVVLAGAVVGRAGEGGVVRLGARRAGDRWGYVDPLALIGRPGPRAPVVLPLGRAPRGLPPPPPRTGRERRNYSYVRSPAGPDGAARAPVVAWIGLALLALGAGTGGVRAAGSLRGRWTPSTSPRRSTT